MVFQIRQKLVLAILFAGFLISSLGADEPPPQLSPYIDVPKPTDFQKVSENIASGIESAMRTLGSLQSSKIKESKEGTRRILVEQPILDAVHFLKATRSPLAAKLLLPFVGVQFELVDKFATNPKLQIEMAADETLKTIGLPAVDEILGEVGDGTLDRTKPNWKVARELAVEILGEEGLKARVGFLKFAKNDKVQRFLSGK